jgi:NRAMP (natural resistance-associated macrophage protein)-like metal ion transporter
MSSTTIPPTPPKGDPPEKPSARPSEAPAQTTRVIEALGPGLTTGAADDDPSGIATYSQVGAQFGYQLGWTMLLTYPLMCAIQQISAVVGRVTGRGLAGNLRRHYPAWVLYGLVALLLVANTLNIGADLGAMAAAVRLLVHGPALLYVVVFGVLSVLSQVFVQYSRYVSILKWLTLSLFAYVATAFYVGVPWRQVGAELVLPHLSFDSDHITSIVAVFGTTISPYLFFWQASQEVERTDEDDDAQPLLDAPRQAPPEMERIRIDTYVGMAFSNIVALFIIITAAATLHASGHTDIQSSAQAAEALRPLAGRFAFTVFALGIIGTGLLALPVLGGSAAYALGEAFRWRTGLAREAHAAKGFYGTIAGTTFVGVLMNFSAIDPVKALFWCAVINGVVAVPVMVLLMLLASRRSVMGEFRPGTVLKTIGWIATAVMALAAVSLAVTSLV